MVLGIMEAVINDIRHDSSRRVVVMKNAVTTRRKNNVSVCPAYKTFDLPILLPTSPIHIAPRICNKASHQLSKYNATKAKHFYSSK